MAATHNTSQPSTANKQTAQTPFTVEGIILSLRKQGLRITNPRRRIIEVLFASHCPLSLREIHRLASTPDCKPDPATVFRVVTLLEHLNLAKKLNFNKSCSFYELRDPNRHYDHLICIKCGAITVIEGPCLLGDIQTYLASRFGFLTTSHCLDFYGICKSCAKQEKDLPDNALPLAEPLTKTKNSPSPPRHVHLNS